MLIINVLKILLSGAEFTFENHEAAFLALLEYEKYNYDYSDILIGYINQAHGSSSTYSFDKRACKSKQFDLIS